MKSLIRIAIFAAAVIIGKSFALAQDYSRDTVRLSATYNRTDFPLVRTGGYEVTENVNGYTAEADVKIFRAGGLRGSLAYNFKQMYNVEVYPDYMVPCPGPVPSIAAVCMPKVFDLYRNVQTHSGFAQLGYTVKDAFEPFAALGYGTRKIHEDAPRQTVRTVRVGVNIPFTKASPFFIKAHVDFEKPYGELPAGFVNPNTRTLSVGAGFRF